MTRIAALFTLAFFALTPIVAADGGHRGTYDITALTRIDFSTLPEPTFFPARDGTPLAVRIYSANASTVIVALHGSSGNGRYYLPMARHLSALGTVAVYAVDLRGHGLSGGRRGDVDYVGQLEDDLADVLTVVRMRHPGARIVLMGHSAGGGLAVRYAGGERKPAVDGYILLAPYLGPWAPTTRPSAGGWATTDTLKIARLKLQSALGITRGQDDVVVRFDMSDAERARGGVGAYTYRMAASISPRSLRGADLAAVGEPLLVLVGERDESFYPDRYEALVHEYTKATVGVLPGITHLELVVHPSTAQAIGTWLATRP